MGTEYRFEVEGKRELLVPAGRGIDGNTYFDKRTDEIRGIISKCNGELVLGLGSSSARTLGGYPLSFDVSFDSEGIEQFEGSLVETGYTHISRKKLTEEEIATREIVTERARRALKRGSPFHWGEGDFY